MWQFKLEKRSLHHILYLKNGDFFIKKKSERHSCPKVKFQETIEPNEESITSRETKPLDSGFSGGDWIFCWVQLFHAILDLQNKVHRNHTFILCNPMLKVGITLHKFIKTKNTKSIKPNPLSGNASNQSVPEFLLPKDYNTPLTGEPKRRCN